MAFKFQALLRLDESKIAHLDVKLDNIMLSDTDDVVHLYVKTDNIMISDDEIVIADFGLAAMLDSSYYPFRQASKLTPK